jgi:hypothetical protein
MFNAQCDAGHVFIVPEGSDLEKRCAKLREEGFAVTETVRSEDCVWCQREDSFVPELFIFIAQGD